MKTLKGGWVEGTVKDFLDLSDADLEYIETRRALSRLLKEKRERLHLTQTQVAARLRTSQSRVAKMEKADPTVSDEGKQKNTWVDPFSTFTPARKVQAR